VTNKWIIREKKVRNIYNGILTKDEMLIKEKSQLVYEENRLELNHEQNRILKAIKKDGICTSSIENLLPLEQMPLWENTIDYFERFVSFENVQKHIISINKYGRPHASAPLNNPNPKKREINARHFLNREVLLKDNCIQLFLTDAILQIVSAFYACAPKAYVFTTWLHPWIPSGTREVSQKWHKDPEGMEVVKVFLYVDDVELENGPFEYVKGSFTKGKNSSLQPYRIKNRYPPDGYIERNVSKDDIFTGIGKKGTLIFADNNGFHRGGYVKKGMRKVMQVSFLEPNTFFANTEEKHRHKLEKKGEHFDELTALAKSVITCQEWNNT